MEKTSMKTASETLEETLQRLEVRYGTTFPASLFRSKKSGQVLYLEAGKDFVDTLLDFLLLPLGTVIRVLSAGIQVNPDLGGISSIFESVQNFSDSDLEMTKEILVQPRPAAPGCSCRSSGLAMQKALEDASILPRAPCKSGLKAGSDADFLRCCECYEYVQCLSGGYCGACLQKRSSVGFVKGNANFIVTDNLEIVPLTTNKSVNVLCKLNVYSVADLEGKDITVTFTQILQLLNSALTSSNCLNEVFGTSK